MSLTDLFMQNIIPKLCRCQHLTAAVSYYSSR